VLAKQEKIRVRSEKFHGGAGLKRWKRFRGFPTIFARHRNFHGNYRIFQGPNLKKLKITQQWWRRVL
jgi:Asp-tRNA(Asn)/Glu-tRNA(Gln) amidotransferase B subunit